MSNLFTSYFEGTQSSLNSIFAGQFDDSNQETQLSTSVITLINALLQIWIAVNQSLPEYTSNASMYDTCLECLHYSVEILNALIVLNNKSLLKFKVDFDHALLVSNFCRYIMAGYPYWTSLRKAKLNHGIAVNRSILKVCSIKTFASTSSVLAHSEDLMSCVESDLKSSNPTSDAEFSLYNEQLNLNVSFLKHCEAEQCKSFARIVCKRCSDEKLSIQTRAALLVFMNTSFDLFDDKVQSLFKKQILNLSKSKDVLLEFGCVLKNSVVNSTIAELISRLLFDVLIANCKPGRKINTSKLFQCMNRFGITCSENSQVSAQIVQWLAQGTDTEIQEKVIHLQTAAKAKLEAVWFLKLLMKLIFFKKSESSSTGGGLNLWLMEILYQCLSNLSLCKFELRNLMTDLCEMSAEVSWIDEKSVLVFADKFIY